MPINKRFRFNTSAAALFLAGLGVANPVLSEDIRPIGDISDDDRLAMMAGAENYGQCLRKEAQAIIGQYNDVRQVADLAMGKCRPALAELDKTMTERRLDPDFRAGFVRHTRDAATRKLLPEIMAAKASQQTP